MEGPPSMIEEGGWTDEIINACINLLKDIKKRYPDIKLTDHSTVAPNRKTDVRKGTSIDEFPWEKVVTESEIPVA
jgi:N-acetyl-anhydromuramyl-L-alanine amidase AmpD